MVFERVTPLALLLVMSGCSAAAVAPTSAPVEASPEGAEPVTDAAPRDDAPALTGLSATVDEVAREYDIPGLAALVFDADGVLDRGQAGVRALGSPDPIGPDDLFHLGSCTKAMTATLLMRLAERKEVDPDATLAQSFPDLAVHASWASSTLSDLLRHRAGAHSMLPVQAPAVWIEFWADARAGTPGSTSRAGAAKTLLTAPAPHTRGEFHYSNTGYILAGGALERATGQSWEDLMRREVFEPLGMSSCGFGPAGSAEAIDQPRGHVAGFTGLSPVTPGIEADNPTALGPAGTVHCSLEDWAAFARVHAGAGPDGYLTQESLDRLHAPAPGEPAYAAGWGVNPREDLGLTLQHAGSNTMNFAMVLISKDTRRGIVVAANAASPSTNEGVGELVDRLSLEHLAPSAEASE